MNPLRPRVTAPWRTAIALLAALATASARPPNVVLILADDLGWKDVGFQGTDFYETPQLDRLAAQGMIFPAAYAGAGNCAPSRACLLSGTYSPRHHVYAVQTTDRGPKARQRLIPIPNRSGLARENVTLADALAAAGYATGIFGKWHLDGPEGADPGEQGFGTVHQSHHTWGDARQRDAANPKGVFSLTQGVNDFMARHRDRPFFAYVSHYSIHTPQEARPATLQRFQAKRAGSQHDNPLYAACLFDLDESIGLLLRQLSALGLAENTLVVFTSDNGGTRTSAQEPLRGNKGSYYEGGIRVPFVARWPGVIAPGTSCATPVINLDLFPTFLAAAGVPNPAGKVLDGVSLLPLFRGETRLPREAIFWHFPGYLNEPVLRGREIDVRDGFRSRPVTVMNAGGWKLHLYHEEWQLDGGHSALPGNRAVELYDLNTDPGENHDLAAAQPRRREELLARTLEWIRTTGALLATQPNPAYDTAALKPGAKKAPARNRSP